jgi:hypothetical protein
LQPATAWQSLMLLLLLCLSWPLLLLFLLPLAPMLLPLHLGLLLVLLLLCSSLPVAIPSCTQHISGSALRSPVWLLLLLLSAAVIQLRQLQSILLLLLLLLLHQACEGVCAAAVEVPMWWQTIPALCTIWPLIIRLLLVLLL